MSAICARLGSKGKVGVQRGRKTAGCPSFLPPRRAPRRSRRPQTANPPLRFSGKLSVPLGRTRLRQFVCPGQPVQKRSRPSGANTLTQFARPAQSVQKRSRPVRSEHADAVRAPRSLGAEKGAAPSGRTRSRSSSTPVSRCRKGAALLGRTRLRQFVHPGQPVQKTRRYSG